jgi:oligoribonuclease NrnB/cAMP/cGMP phosphodiesterase (DHH superfamily)
MKYVLSHKKDCDGLMSAAIYLRANPDAEIILIDYEESEIDRILKTFDEMLNKDPGFIVIADFVLMPAISQLIVSKLSKLKEKGWQIMWVDHHQWREDIKRLVSNFVKLYINTSHCASELMREKFGNNDKVYDVLAEIGKDTDFHLNRYLISSLLTDIITYYNYLKDDAKLRTLAYKLSQGILWDTEINNEWKKYLIIKKSAINELELTISTKLIKGYTVSIGFSDMIISYSEALDIIMRKSNCDLAIVVFKNGSLILRRQENTNLPCNKIAEFFNGGGHLFIAGGQLPKELRIKYDMVKWREYIFNKIEEAISILNF